MTIAATPASSLAHVLREVSEMNGPPRQRWETVLDAEFGTPEFTLRHAAVMETFHYTARAIVAEPAGKGRDARLAQLPAWWQSVVGPAAVWDRSDSDVSLDAQSLRFLDLTAERLEDLHAGGASGELDPALLDDLLGQAKEWLKEVTAERTLNRGLQMTLIQHLENLIWTIENAGRFGVGLVVPAADQASGALLRATASNPGLWQRWGKKVAAFVSAIVLLLTGYNQGVDAVEHTVSIVQGELGAGDAGSGGSVAADKSAD